jgi:hypothetical protein
MKMLQNESFFDPASVTPGLPTNLTTSLFLRPFSTLQLVFFIIGEFWLSEA